MSSFNSLPQVTKQLYTTAYDAFKKWRKDTGNNSICEDVMLVYFDKLSETYSPSSLWSYYSMLKSTINNFDQIDITDYKRLLYLLKTKNEGYQPKKSSVFTKEDISKFLSEAPDDLYLSVKVALIIGISGGLKRHEFVHLKVSDITESSNFILVTTTKNKVSRSFKISDGLYDICKKYIRARPEKCSTDRFFIKYVHGKCVQQPIGINMFGSMPKQIATYLNLDDPDTYTGHSFRRTSATLLVEAGADITELIRHGGWKSATVAKEYIADSVNNKKRTRQTRSSDITLLKKNRIKNEASDDVGPVSVHSVQTPSTSDHLDEPPTPKRNRTVTETSLETPSVYPFLEVKVDSFADTSSPNKEDSFQEVQENSFADISSDTENSSIETPSISSFLEVQVDSLADSSSPKKDQKLGSHITITGDVTIKNDHIEHPVLKSLALSDSDQTLVFNNCNIRIEGGSYKSMVFNNCNIYK